MPSKTHEALIELFRHRPGLAAQLLRDPLGVPLPDYAQVRLDSGDLPDLTPTEYRADAVVVLATATGDPALAVVLEVQLRRDARKQWSWPVYLATLRARLRCPAVLLVMCTDTATAAWCATPIDLGHPGWVLSALVLGPDRVPVVTDEEQARRMPELAVLSAMAHGGAPGQRKVLDAAASAFASIVDADRARLYSDVVFEALPEAARQYLEGLMKLETYEPQSDFLRGLKAEGRVEGKAEGEAAAVLEFLDARGIDVPDDARDRITGCTDLDQLRVWIRRAATIGSVGDLFD